MVIGLKDLLLAIPFLLIIRVWARNRKRRLETNQLRLAFEIGLWLRVFGAILLGLVYQFYYGSGDTFGYYSGGQGFMYYLFSDPGGAISYLFNSTQDGVEQMRYHATDWGYNYLYKMSSPPELLMAKITGLVNIVALNSYLSVAIIFGWLSFIGSWKLFQVFEDVIPYNTRFNAIAALYVPSVVFWGSGILKDTVSLTALCWLTYSAFQLFMYRKKVILNSAIVIATTLIIGTIKGYILLAFIPALIFFLVNQFKTRLRSKVIRTAITPVLVGLGLLLGAVFINQIGASLGKYSLESLESSARATQTWHETVSTRQEGSGYTLGEVDFSTSGMLTQLPAAVNVALFRPYVWEADQPIVLLSALEAAAFLLLTLFVVIRAGPIRLLRSIAGHPFSQFCLLFIIIFAFAVGLTSYNFGALVRYKIPMLPFFAAFLLYQLARVREARRKKTGSHEELPAGETVLSTFR